MPEITKKFIETVKPAKVRYEIYCSKIPGLVLRVLPSGKKVIFIRYRDKNNIDTKERIGLINDFFSFEEALNIAKAKLSKLDRRNIRNDTTKQNIIRVDGITGSIFVEQEIKPGTREYVGIVLNMWEKLKDSHLH